MREEPRSPNADAKLLAKCTVNNPQRADGEAPEGNADPRLPLPSQLLIILMTSSLYTALQDEFGYTA